MSFAPDWPWSWIPNLVHCCCLLWCCLHHLLSSHQSSPVWLFHLDFVCLSNLFNWHEKLSKELYNFNYINNYSVPIYVIFIIGPFLAYFLYLFFSIQLLLLLIINRSFSGWIWTADLWCWQRPLYQLSPQPLPKINFVRLS